MSVKERREIFCIHYSECLLNAALKSELFSCGECKGYQQEIREPSEWAREALQCALLIKAAGLYTEGAVE